MANNRIYNFRDVDMLTASRTIAESLRANIAELSVISHHSSVISHKVVIKWS